MCVRGVTPVTVFFANAIAPWLCNTNRYTQQRCCFLIRSCCISRHVLTYLELVFQVILNVDSPSVDSLRATSEYSVACQHFIS